MTDRDRGEDAYTGRAGQQAFIAQVLLRFGNAAVPVVDVGTDVVVLSDTLDLSARVQVKTGKVIRNMSGGYAVQFTLPLKQLDTDDVPPLFYALVTRDEELNTFPDVLILSRPELQEYRNGPHMFGTVEAVEGVEKYLRLRVVFDPRLGVLCKHVNPGLPHYEMP